MKAKTTILLAVAALMGCAPVHKEHANYYYLNPMRPNMSDYAAITPKLHYRAEHELNNSLGDCPILEFYEHFPQYDEIVNIIVSQYEAKEGWRRFRACEYQGTGVVYKGGRAE